MYTCTNTSTQMDNKVTTHDGADNDIKQRQFKARETFMIGNQVKLHAGQNNFFFYISCILPIFLYGSESWSMIDKQARRQHFIQSL